MLQPQNYPKLLGQALVLEPDPFVEMVDDDNPWVEGLFLCACIGVLIGAAQVIRSLLLSGMLPPSEAVLGALVQGLRQAAAGGEALLEIERSLNRIWPFFSFSSGYGSGWLRLLYLPLVPFAVLVQWLLFGTASHLIARAAGGQGSLSQTLGAVALSNGPRLLLLLTAIPFVSVSGLLIHVWGVLIAYRGLEVAHELPPGRAALAALGPWILLLLLASALAGAVGALTALAGGTP